MLVKMDRFDLIKRGGGDNPPFLFSEKIELHKLAAAVGQWDTFIVQDITFANVKKLFLTYGMVDISGDDSVTLQTLPFVKAGCFINAGAGTDAWPQIPQTISGAPNYVSNKSGFVLQQGRPSELNFGLSCAGGDVKLNIDSYIFYNALVVNNVDMYVTLSLSGYAYRS